MTSYRLRIMGALMRPLVRFGMERIEDPLRMRRDFDLGARIWFRRVSGAQFRPAKGGLWVTVGKHTPGQVLLYFHGGGYLAGSPQTHRHVVARLCAMSGLQAYVPRYSLAPESPPPACLADATAAFDDLVAQGFAPQNIVLGGDSAGGGLALLLLSRLCQRGTPPGGCFAWSPFCDMTFSGASVGENGRRDHFFPGHRSGELAAMILHNIAPDDPAVSPLFADFPNCPPVLIQAATGEILRDDAVRMVAKLQAAGADAHLQMWDDAPHVWQLFDGWFPEAREAIGKTATFIKALLPPPAEN